MVFLADENNWQTLLNSAFNQSKGAIKISVYEPLVSHTIRLQVTSDEANARWFLGGYLHHLLNPPNHPNPMIAASIKIPLGWHYVLKLNHWSEIYYLQFEPVKWLNNFHFKLDVFNPLSF